MLRRFLLSIITIFISNCLVKTQTLYLGEKEFKQLYEDQRKLTFKMVLSRDTIFLGEPIIGRCKIVNMTQKPLRCAVRGTHKFLAMAGDFEARMKAPFDDRDLIYAPGSFEVYAGIERPSVKTILPSDSLYWYAYFGWNFWNPNGVIKSFQPGIYEITGEFHQLYDTLKLYVKELPDNEKPINEKLEKIFQDFFFWGEAYESSDRAIKLRKEMKNCNSIFAVYYDFIYPQLNGIGKPTGPGDRFEACDEFLKKYSNHFLREDMEFVKAILYESAGRKTEAKILAQEAVKKYPRNAYAWSGFIREILK